MPIHLKCLDVADDLKGLDSALVVSCNMCAGASLAMEEQKPFLQFFKRLLVSPPLERYVGRLTARLREKGIRSEWFRKGAILQFFLCLWTAKQRRSFRKCAKDYQAVIVLGCDSAIKTVRDSVEGLDYKVVKGMEVEGIMNTKPRLRFPCNITFEACKVATVCDRHCKRAAKTAC